MRALTALVALTLSACSVFRGAEPRSDQDVVLSLSIPADSALRIAMTQLQLHNYTVNAAGPGLLVTAPRAVPDYLIEVSNAPTTPRARQQWILRVEATPHRFVSGAQLRINAYILPSTGALTAGNAVARHAIPVTAENARLFREVQMVGSWIEQEARRQKRSP